MYFPASRVPRSPTTASGAARSTGVSIDMVVSWPVRAVGEAPTRILPGGVAAPVPAGPGWPGRCAAAPHRRRGRIRWGNGRCDRARGRRAPGATGRREGSGGDLRVGPGTGRTCRAAAQRGGPGCSSCSSTGSSSMTSSTRRLRAAGLLGGVLRHRVGRAEPDRLEQVRAGVVGRLEVGHHGGGAGRRELPVVAVAVAAERRLVGVPLHPEHPLQRHQLHGDGVHHRQHLRPQRRLALVEELGGRQPHREAAPLHHDLDRRLGAPLLEEGADAAARSSCAAARWPSAALGWLRCPELRAGPPPLELGPSKMGSAPVPPVPAKCMAKRIDWTAWAIRLLSTRDVE